jgi:hypothetical protein
VLKQLRRQLVIPFHPLRLVYPQLVALLPVMAVLVFQNLRFYNLHLILPFAWLFLPLFLWLTAFSFPHPLSIFSKPRFWLPPTL